MSTATPDPMEFLVQYRLGPSTGPGTRRLLDRSKELFTKVQQNPHEVVAELMRAETLRDHAQLAAAKSKEAAEGIHQLLHNMVNGNAEACRCDGIIETAAGVRAICRQGERIRELSVHPDVSLDQLRTIQPWEYVRVHENVVVGVRVDDPTLLESSLGEIVTFQGYAGSSSLARVTRLGNTEEIVRLASSISQQTIPPHAKLVLMRDNPRWAIACLPSQPSTSRFEVPIDSIRDRLSNLAGVEPLAEKLLLEVVKRILQPEIREMFNLDPLRGMLLCSEKPGMGKTAFMRAFAGTLHDIGQYRDFDVVLYLVKPNEFKSMWHGEDARIVREELFGAIRARRELPRSRAMIQLVVMDEIDSLGRRPEGRDAVVSSAQSDALETFLVEMDGMVQEVAVDPPAHLLVVGMTNRPERIDDAIKRPGRLGDEVIEIPDLDMAGAEQVCLVYARAARLPWLLDDVVSHGVTHDEIVRRFLRPAVRAVFNAVILRYMNDTQKKFEVTAGQVLAAVHYRKAMNVAKNRAANRRLRGVGVQAIAYEDVVEGLLDTALSVAHQMQSDPHMLVRHLKIKIPVVRVDAVSRDELQDHHFVRSLN